MHLRWKHVSKVPWVQWTIHTNTHAHAQAIVVGVSCQRAVIFLGLFCAQMPLGVGEAEEKKTKDQWMREHGSRSHDPTVGYDDFVCTRESMWASSCRKAECRIFMTQLSRLCTYLVCSSDHFSTPSGFVLPSELDQLSPAACTIRRGR